jgi:hypothetical protein
MYMGFKIPWVEGSKYHGLGVQYNMDRGLNIQWVGRSKYHGNGVLYTMDKGFDIPLRPPTYGI